MTFIYWLVLLFIWENISAFESKEQLLTGTFSSHLTICLYRNARKFYFFDIYHVPTNSYTINMCLSNLDLLNFAKMFGKLHYIIYWLCIYLFFLLLFIPKTQTENFLSLYGIPNEDKQDLHFLIWGPDFHFDLWE